MLNAYIRICVPRGRVDSAITYFSFGAFKSLLLSNIFSEPICRKNRDWSISKRVGHGGVYGYLELVISRSERINHDQLYRLPKIFAPSYRSASPTWERGVRLDLGCSH